MFEREAAGSRPRQRVERLGAGRLAVHEVAVSSLLGKPFRDPGLHLWQQRAVGVEDAVHLADEAGTMRRLEDLGWAVVAVLPVVEPLVVRDVARGLLEVGHQPAPLEDLCQNVRRLLARKMNPAELRDRIVAIFDEDLLVELLGARQPDRRVDRRVTRDVEVTDELVEEEAAQAFGRTRVAGEECPLDHLREVDQGKHRLVQVRHIAAEDGLLVRGEALFGVREHGRPTLERGCCAQEDGPMGQAPGTPPATTPRSRRLTASRAAAPTVASGAVWETC